MKFGSRKSCDKQGKLQACIQPEITSGKTPCLSVSERTEPSATYGRFHLVSLFAHYQMAWEHFHQVSLTRSASLHQLLPSSELTLPIARLPRFIEIRNFGSIVGFGLGLTIDVVTSIIVIISIGLCVDYSAHIAHAFLTSQGKYRIQSCIDSL